MRRELEGVRRDEEGGNRMNHRERRELLFERSWEKRTRRGESLQKVVDAESRRTQRRTGRGAEREIRGDLLVVDCSRRNEIELRR